MQVEKKVESLALCQCGYQPDTVTIGYGSTPYDVHCPQCSKQTYTYRQVGGNIGNIIEFWNTIAPLIELRDNGNLVYEYDGNTYNYYGVRPAMLKSWDEGKYHIPVYILFVNGKIECDPRQWIRKDD